MSDRLWISAAAVVDEVALRGSSGTRLTFAELGLDPAGGSIAWQPLFGTRFREFRRLDLTTRMFVIAAEACGLDTRLDEETRPATALVLATSTGCLAADRGFEASLHVDKGILPALFPYTLPSTCLGEVAIRHRLQGPTLCLSVAVGAEVEGLRAAAGLLRAGACQAALVLLGDWVAGKTRAAALLLRGGGPDTPRLADLADLADLSDRDAGSTPAPDRTDLFDPIDRIDRIDLIDLIDRIDAILPH